MKEISVEESKKLLFDILVYFDQICRENCINYSLGEGSLLGAVRHKGFIPWDDDIDILMTRADFSRFLNIHKDGVYKIYHVNPDVNYWNSVARLSDTRTAVYLGKSNYSMHCLWLGLTPVDNIPDDDRKWNRMKKRIAFWVRLCRQKKGVIPVDQSIKGKFLKYFFKIVTVDWLDKRFKRVVTAYDSKPTKRMSKLNIRYEPFVFPSTVFDGFTELEFEGQKFMALKHYDDYLKLMYGDYMTPPPEKDRITKHDYKAYYKY